MSEDIKDHKEITRANIRVNAQLDVPFLAMNTLAAIIASYGLLANSAAVVIGAMIVAMLFSPILGLALGLVEGEKLLVRHAIKSLIVGSILVYFTAFLIGFLHSDIPITPEIMARTAPNFLDLMVAFAGGAAGAYATISPRLSTSFVGVAIATALVPPLCASAILLGHGNFELARGAFLLTFTNIVAIQFVSSVVLWLNGFHGFYFWQKSSLWELLKRNFITLILLVILVIALSVNLHNVVARQLYESKVTRIVSEQLLKFPNMRLIKVGIEEEASQWIVRVTVGGIKKPDASFVQLLESELTQAGQEKPATVRVRYFQVDVIDRDGDVKAIQEQD
ncbi:TIGR00341 family protein [Shewanella sp. FJAT-51649]|uniref:TIGR00341 family protein n=1 Tax=Shewanella sp. FJAT-51649 TaxID=2864210 RepID=UPI001C65B482|nr:TIGR00341 family protein [Shewanella sp. FJAT-51649]QYJ72573.1 TIGR00341 family protein [Shewanella sp. FJAT-51649]